MTGRGGPPPGGGRGVDEGPPPGGGGAAGGALSPAASSELAARDPSDTPTGGVDASRIRSFVGLSIGLVGPRANLAVSGVLITLYIQQRASSALAVTFALTANRLFSWVTYPVAGRLSDRTQTHIGRRTPYMGGSLIVLGAATWMFTVVRGYWLLVLFIVVAGQAAAVFTLTNVAVVPEVFGRSRWVKALLLTTVLGTVASLAIKATVITSWNQHDPSTWNLPFRVAAVIMAGVGLVVLVLVREAPAASYGASADRRERDRPAREELRAILAGPNAKVLVSGSLLFWSGIGSTAYIAILFFQRILHAGASAQTVAGLATGIPVFLLGVILGIPLSRIMGVKQLAVAAPLIGAVLAGVQYFDTHLWQAVALSYIGAPFVGAYIIALAPLLLRLLPRAGGLGERLGVLLSPFNLCGVVLAYVAAVVIDATGNYRLIWLFPAATGIAHATVNCWLRIPPRLSSTTSDPVSKVWTWAVEQAESMADQGLVKGLLAAPLLGTVSQEDADSAVVVDLARDILGDPYAEDSEDPDSDQGPSDAPGSEEGDAAGDGDAVVDDPATADGPALGPTASGPDDHADHGDHGDHADRTPAITTTSPHGTAGDPGADGAAGSGGQGAPADPDASAEPVQAPPDSGS